MFFDTLSPSCRSGPSSSGSTSHSELRQRGVHLPARPHYGTRIGVDAAGVRTDWPKTVRFKHATTLSDRLRAGNLGLPARCLTTATCRCCAPMPRLSAEGVSAIAPYESNGWRELVRGELTVVELACSHRHRRQRTGGSATAKALKRVLE